MKPMFQASVMTAGMVVSLTTLAPAAIASSDFIVTLEDPTVQQSALLTNPAAYGAQDVFQEDFESLPQGFDSNGFNFFSGQGSYSAGNIVGADQFGGANGTGNYLTVHPGQRGASGDYSVSSLNLNSDQRYFGFWWSAGDAFNRVEFYSNNQLVADFTTADVINFIAGQANAAAYYGNPTANFAGQNGGEPYAFINFFAQQNVTFDRIDFINPSSGTGFESDNHTIAANYTDISGTPIQPVPEPTTLLGAVAALGLGSWFKRRHTNNRPSTNA